MRIIQTTNPQPDYEKAEHDSTYSVKKVSNFVLDANGNLTREKVGGNNLAIIIDEFSPSITYIGSAMIGAATSSASWQIKKITTSGSITTITWADGNDLFDNVWDNRIILNYS